MCYKSILLTVLDVSMHITFLPQTLQSIGVSIFVLKQQQHYCIVQRNLDSKIIKITLAHNVKYVTSLMLCTFTAIKTSVLVPIYCKPKQTRPWKICNKMCIWRDYITDIWVLFSTLYSGGCYFPERLNMFQGRKKRRLRSGKSNNI